METTKALVTQGGIQLLSVIKTQNGALVPNGAQLLSKDMLIARQTQLNTMLADIANSLTYFPAPTPPPAGDNNS